MIISTRELREVCDTLLTHIEEVTPSVEVREDFYWAVPPESRYDPYEQPSDLTLGQLSDDWGELEKIRAGEREPHPYALVWLASILRYVGENAIHGSGDDAPRG